MKLALKKIIINNESDIEENGVEKVVANISIIATLVGKTTEVDVVIPTTVISLNSDTGVDMDAQREVYCQCLINNF